MPWNARKLAFWKMKLRVRLSEYKDGFTWGSILAEDRRRQVEIDFLTKRNEKQEICNIFSDHLTKSQKRKFTYAHLETTKTAKWAFGYHHHQVKHKSKGYAKQVITMKCVSSNLAQLLTIHPAWMKSGIFSIFIWPALYCASWTFGTSMLLNIPPPLYLFSEPNSVRTIASFKRKRKSKKRICQYQPGALIT